MAWVKLVKGGARDYWGKLTTTRSWRLHRATGDSGGCSSRQNKGMRSHCNGTDLTLSK